MLAVTLDDVRAEAGVSVGAIYHHFADKQALAAAVYTDVLAGYQAEFLAVLDDHADPQHAIRAVVEHLMAWCEAKPDEAAFLLAGRPAGADERVRELNEAFFRRVRAWWRPHVHHRALRDLPFDVVSALWIGPALELARHRRPVAPRAVATLAEAAVATLTTKEIP